MPTDSTAEERAERIRFINSPEYREAEVFLFHLMMKQAEAKTVGDNIEINRYVVEQFAAAAQAAREKGIAEGRRLEAEEVQGWVKDDMRDARAQAFDEAAKVAEDNCPAGASTKMKHTCDALKIAAAILALKEKRGAD